MSMISSVQTGSLALHYRDSGPTDGLPVLLLHGWPDDAFGWDGVADHLNAAGFRTIAPFLRGFGPTRFLRSETPRSAQLTALASDAVALADALGLARFAVVGHDWGARTAYVLAALWPQRLTHCVALSVGIGRQGVLPSLQQASQFWYQWYFALPQGAARLAAEKETLCRYLWHSWSPSWHLDDGEFQRTAASFANPDWLAITLHGYRHRWGLVAGDPAYDALEQQLAEVDAINVPTLLLHGEADACIEPDSSLGLEDRFQQRYRRVGLPGCGHFPQREQPEVVARFILEWLRSR